MQTASSCDPDCDRGLRVMENPPMSVQLTIPLQLRGVRTVEDSSGKRDINDRLRIKMSITLYSTSELLSSGTTLNTLILQFDALAQHNIRMTK